MAKVGVLSCALASLAFAVIMLLACSDFGHGTSSQIEEQTQNDTGINILTSAFPSPKEQNPFSVENMNKAFKSFILEKNANAKDIPELKANFLYVRFLPYGRQGEHELKAYDSSLALFKYPMDYNEIRKPVVYIDKTLPDSIVPYFASVPVGYEFGATPYEILQELFLTQPLEEDDGDSQEGSRFVRAKKSNKANKEISAYMKSQGLAPSQFEATVLINSGNSEIVGAADGQNRILARSSSAPDDMVAWSWPWEKWTRWTPGGTLTFKDSSLVGNQPLVDARVTAGYIYYWRSSWTDSKGHFKSPEKWTYSVHYEVLFDSYDFLLKDGHSWGGWYATDLSHKKKGTSYHQWDENFTGDVAKWCVVWTAAWNYWHGSDIGGLQRPRQSNWLNRMDIKVYYEPNNFDVKGRYRNPAIFEDIQIQAYDRKHVAIYGTTIHEIAHSVHFANLDLSAGNAVAGASMGYLANVAGYSPLSASAAVLGVKGWQSLKYEGLPLILKESYARGVQRYLVIKRYGAGAWNRILYDNHWYDNEYTGIFEDLEDTNTTFANAKNDKNPCDRVSGITVPMAEKVFFKSDSWNGFKNNLMKAYPNGFSNEKGGKVSYTAEDMNALFKYWEKGETSCLKDFRDGKVYKTAKIGTQKWLAENLNYDTTGSKCYGNYQANCDKYGRLYDWSTAMALPSSCNSISCSKQISRKTKRGSYHGICPDKWRVPSVEDWNKLARYIDGDNSTHSPYDSPTAGIYLKAKSGWNGGYIDDIYRNGNGEDKYGFSALPGGIGKPDGTFKDMGFNGDWWSATEYDDSGAYRFDVYYGDKAGWSDIEGTNRKYDKAANLFSVRCLEN